MEVFGSVVLGYVLGPVWDGNMLVCPCGEPDPEELKSLFFPPLFKRPPQLPGAQDGSSQYPSPYHWCYYIMQGNLNEQMFTAQSILPFNFAHLWWWEYLNIQTENTYGCLPVSTIFFTPASETVNMGMKHLLCFQQEKRLQRGTTTNILYFWLRFFFNC